MSWPRPDRETGRAARPVMPVEPVEIDDDGFLGPADDPAGEPPPPASEPPLASRRPAAPAPAAPRLTDDEIADHYAAHIAGTSASAVMYFTMAGVFRDAGPLAYQKYRDKLLADCGAPADPVEVMLVEQLALAHMNTDRLYAKAAMTEDLGAARAYGALAIALAGEVRRTALALQAFRATPPLAAPGAGGGGTRAAAVDAAGAALGGGVGGEQGSKRGDERHGDDTIPIAEPAAGRGGPQEPGETPRPVRRRPRQAS